MRGLMILTLVAAFLGGAGACLGAPTASEDFGRARSLVAGGDLAGAASTLKGMLSSEGYTLSMAERRRVTATLARVYLKLGKVPQARRCVAYLRRLVPEDPDVARLTAEVEASAGAGAVDEGGAAEALEAVDEALSLREVGGTPDADELEKAKKILAGKRQGRSPDELFALGAALALTSTEPSPQAEELLSGSLVAGRADPRAHLLLAELARRRSDTGAELAALERARSVGASGRTLWRALVRVYGAVGNTEQGREALERLVETAPSALEGLDAEVEDPELRRAVFQAAGLAARREEASSEEANPVVPVDPSVRRVREVTLPPLKPGSSGGCGGGESSIRSSGSSVVIRSSPG